MHYFLSSGEASGDLHAAELIKCLRKADPEARFTFLGGDACAEAAGSQPVIHIRDMAFMGFSEVLRHLPRIWRNMRTARRTLAEAAPDALILVDYPSFNLRLAATAKALGIPVYYYISPKVWAWKEWRVRKIKKLVTRMYAIFPFETEFYRRHGMEVEYVGNPSVEEVEARLGAAPSREDFLKAHRLRDRKIIALLPGSRRGEIRNNLRIMCRAVDMMPQYRGVIAGAPGIEPEFYKQFTDLPVLHGQTYNLLAHSHAALVTSGTATLEAALARVPQVVTYRANGSELSYKLMKRLLKVNFVSLPNLIAGREIIPEQLLHLCTPELVGERLAAILPERQARQSQLDGYEEMRRILGYSHAAEETARRIIESLKTIQPS
ncbi:MAG: lipid-A-disaccharide synthase [Muribaculaceae bacterium]|nr:lipid-A-disaccharide synthase [Muribaculaceae bacterium]